MTTALDAAFAAATTSPEPPTDSDAPRALLPAGSYEGVIQSAEVRAGFRPWVEQELSLRIQIKGGEHDGRTTFCDIELAPLTGRDGQISEGKMRYVKWQITDVLGYEGPLSDLTSFAPNVIGLRIQFDQKVSLSPKLNPRTGKPYENREVTLRQALGRDEVVTPDLSDFQPVNTPGNDDDDIPF